ncbi:hypothetical protein TorRG33x02_319980, partial [Trema orientale]
ELLLSINLPPFSCVSKHLHTFNNLSFYVTYILDFPSPYSISHVKSSYLFTSNVSFYVILILDFPSPYSCVMSSLFLSPIYRYIIITSITVFFFNFFYLFFVVTNN